MKTLYPLTLIVLLASCNGSQNYDQTNIFDVDSVSAVYHNSSYGYRLSFPKKLVIPQEESGNGDGRYFTDKKDNEIFVVYGSSWDTLATSYNVDLKQLANNPKKIHILYKEITPSWSIISASNKDSIFYYKRIESGRGVASFLAAYKKTDSAKYSTLIKSIADSLQAVEAIF